MKMDETKTVIMEHENNLLVRVDSSVMLGDKEYKTLSFEIWTDREKYEANISDEWKKDGQYLYCTNYAMTDQEDMIRTFKQRFMN